MRMLLASVWMTSTNVASSGSSRTNLGIAGRDHSKTFQGGAVAECSKALLVRENKRSQKIPGLPPGLGNFKKKYIFFFSSAASVSNLGQQNGKKYFNHCARVPYLSHLNICWYLKTDYSHSHWAPQDFYAKKSIVLTSTRDQKAHYFITKYN